MKVGKYDEKAKHENSHWLLTTISLRSLTGQTFPLEPESSNQEPSVTVLRKAVRVITVRFPEVSYLLPLLMPFP